MTPIVYWRGWLGATLAASQSNDKNITIKDTSCSQKVCCFLWISGSSEQGFSHQNMNKLKAKYNIGDGENKNLATL